MQDSKGFLFILCVCVFVLLGLTGGLLNIAWTYMHDAFNVGIEALGILLAFGTAGILIGTFGSGTLIGRFGLGRVTLGGVVLLAIGLAGIAFSTMWALLLVIFLMTYIGRGLIDASLNNFISDHYGATEMNWLHASWGIGLTLAPGIITVIVITLGWSWRVGYLALAGVALGFSLIILLTLKQWRITDVPIGEINIADTPTRSVRETLQQPGIWLGMLVFFVYGGIEISTGQLANTLFVDGRGVSQDVASLFITLYWGSFTIGRIAVGVLALRVRAEILLRLSVIMALLGTALLIPNFSNETNLIALILIGSGLSGFLPILVLQTPARVGKRYAAQAIGFQIGFGGFGGAIVPGVLGFVGARFGIEFIAYGLFINAILLVIGYVMLIQYSSGAIKAKPA